MTTTQPTQSRMAFAVEQCSSRPRRRVELAGCLTVVMVLSVALNWSLVVSGNPRFSLMSPGIDIAEQVWF
ncbi:MAG: hypothetical protein WCK25_06445, partial [Actinomycetes bacterium]